MGREVLCPAAARGMICVILLGGWRSTTAQAGLSAGTCADGPRTVATDTTDATARILPDTIPEFPRITPRPGHGPIAPSATSAPAAPAAGTPVPLPPAAWTGLTGLAALGLARLWRRVGRVLR